MAIDPEREFAEAIAHATVLSDQHRYREAGAHFARAGAFALDHDATDAARQAWGAAGEAFRRDDAVEQAARALRLALTLSGGTADEIALQRVQLAGVLAERGLGGAAIDQCHQARDVSMALQPLVLDALVGTLLGYGTRAEIEIWVPQLDGDGPAHWSYLLRNAQLLRLQGELAQANQHLAELEKSMDGRPGVEAGLGGVRAERAEIASLRGEAKGAAEVWIQARDDQRSAGRRSLALRCEAGRVRCLVDAGVAVVSPELIEGLSWAEERGMVLLGLDIQLALGMLGSDGERLRRVREKCLECGLIRRAGRAEYRRALTMSGAARLAPLQEASGWLAEDEPRRLRSELLRAETLASLAPEAGRTLGASLLAGLTAAGMEPELARLRGLMEA